MSRRQFSWKGTYTIASGNIPLLKMALNITTDDQLVSYFNNNTLLKASISNGSLAVYDTKYFTITDGVNPDPNINLLYYTPLYETYKDNINSIVPLSNFGSFSQVITEIA